MASGTLVGGPGTRTGPLSASSEARSASSRAATFPNLSWLPPAWPLRLCGASGPGAPRVHALTWRSPAAWQNACWPFPSPSNKAAARRRGPSTGKRGQSRAVWRQTPHQPAPVEMHTRIRHTNRTLHQLFTINFRCRGLPGPNPRRRPNRLRFPGDERSPPSGQGENPGMPEAA